MYKKTNAYIEINRILYTLCIILMHGENLWRDISGNRIFEGGYIGVDFFFIVSGFFIAKSLEKKELTTKDYFISRIYRLYPHYILSIIFITIILVLCGNDFINLSQCFFQHIFMIQNLTPIVKEINGPLWYVTYLVIISTLIFYLQRKHNKNLVYYALIYMFTYYIFASIVFGHLDDVYTILFVPSRFYRAIADIILGLFCYNISKRITKEISKYNIVWIIPLMILQYCLSFKFPHSRVDFLTVIIFALSVVFTSKMEFKNCTVIYHISKYTYPVYCYQILAFYIIEFIYRHSVTMAQLSNTTKLLFVLFVCIVLGVLSDVFLNLVRRIYNNKIIKEEL